MDLFGFKKRKAEREKMEHEMAYQEAMNKLLREEMMKEAARKMSSPLRPPMKDRNPPVDNSRVIVGRDIYYAKPDVPQTPPIMPKSKKFPKPDFIEELMMELLTSDYTPEFNITTEYTCDFSLELSPNSIIVKKEEELSYRKISEREGFEKVFAFRLEKRFGDKVTDVSQGVTSQFDIDNYMDSGVFKNTFVYDLMETKKLHEILANPKRRESIEYEDLHIDNVYDSGIVIDGNNEYCLVQDRIYTEGRMVDFTGAYHPIGIEMNARRGIDSLNYDLEELLGLLRLREDIVFHVGDNIFDIKGMYVTRPQLAKYGTCAELRFIWIPNEEDYNECHSELEDTFRPELAPIRVFGIRRKEIAY